MRAVTPWPTRGPILVPSRLISGIGISATRCAIPSCRQRGSRASFTTDLSVERGTKPIAVVAKRGGATSLVFGTQRARRMVGGLRGIVWTGRPPTSYNDVSPKSLGPENLTGIRTLPCPAALYGLARVPARCCIKVLWFFDLLAQASRVRFMVFWFHGVQSSEPPRFGVGSNMSPIDNAIMAQFF